MLEAAVAVADRQRHEHIAVHRRAPAGRLEQTDLRFADAFQVGAAAAPCRASARGR